MKGERFKVPCWHCGSLDVARDGTTQKGRGLWKCASCGRIFILVLDDADADWNRAQAEQPTPAVPEGGK